MGGFVFDNSGNPESHPFDHGQGRATIPRRTLVWLAENEPDVIPDISSQHITDKSKANGLAKLLVCVQAGYFALQIIVRLGQGLAVTLLELNVFAHVVCALFTYAFWWNKPLDIDEPTSIHTDDPKLGSICAALWYRSQLGWNAPLVVRRGQPTTEPLLGAGFQVDQMILSPQLAQELWSQCFNGTSVAPHQGIRYLSNRESISGDILLRLRTDRTYYSDLEDRIFIELDHPLVKAELDRLVLENLNTMDLNTVVLGPDDQIYAAFKEDHLQCHLCANRHQAGQNLMRLSPSEFWNYRTLKPPIRNWHWFKRDDDWATQIGLFTAASVLYGAWHLTAWNGPFRTTTEGILWKVSAVGVSVSLILGEALLALMYKWRLKPFPGNTHSETLPGPGKMITASKVLHHFILYLLLSLSLLNFGLCGLLCFLLFFSRTYLVVESFISLAFVPDAVFAIPQWSFYIPHIG